MYSVDWEFLSKYATLCYDVQGNPLAFYNGADDLDREG